MTIDIGRATGRPAQARPTADLKQAQLLIDTFARQLPAAWRGLSQFLEVAYGADILPALVEVVATDAGRPPLSG